MNCEKSTLTQRDSDIGHLDNRRRRNLPQLSPKLPNIAETQLRRCGHLRLRHPCRLCLSHRVRRDPALFHGLRHLSYIEQKYRIFSTAPSETRGISRSRLSDYCCHTQVSRKSECGPSQTRASQMTGTFERLLWFFSATPVSSSDFCCHTPSWVSCFC